MSAAPVEAVEFAIRPRRPDDDAFIYNSFLKCYCDSRYNEGLSHDVYYPAMKAEWAKVMERFSVAVAHPEGEPDEIAGWIAWTGRVIAFVYVKRYPWRGMGVARTLLKHVGVLPQVQWKALYGSPSGLALARSKGFNVALLAHVHAVRLLNLEVGR